MKTKLYLLCIFLFFVAVFLTVYSGNSTTSIGMWMVGFMMGEVVGLLLYIYIYAELTMKKTWYLSIPGLLTGSVMVVLLIILPFEIAVSIIFSFFLGLFVGHYLLNLD